MKKFRLNRARQKGEQIAKEYGFEKFPVDPFAIAKKENILVEAKSPEQDGASGFIVFSGDGVGIGYSTRISNIGFQNFTIAHELGHYFLEGHPEEISKSGGHHSSSAGFTQGNRSIEIEADHFASGLLMPTFLVKEFLASKTIGLEGIKELSDTAKSSLTASAIRAAECASFPIAVVVSHGGEICYCFMSDSFKALGSLDFLRKGEPLPLSATLEFNKVEGNILNRETICESTTLSDWFGGTKNIPLDEEVTGLGHYGLTLTVLSSEQLPEDPDDDDEEQELSESWTPKFAYGR